MTHNCSSAKY